DIASGKEMRRCGDEKSYVRCLAVAPNGETLTYGTYPDGMVHIWDTQSDIVLWETATGKERMHFAMNEGQVSQIIFSPDGRLLARSGRTEAICLWDTWTGKELGRLMGHRGWIPALAFTPDGKKLASGGADTNVLVWDVAAFVGDKLRAG